MTDRGLEQSGLTSWSFGELPEHLSQTRGGLLFRAFPALVDDKTSVALRLFDSPELAKQEMAWGLARLLRLTLADQVRFMIKAMGPSQPNHRAGSQYHAKSRVAGRYRFVCAAQCLSSGTG